MNRSVLLAVIMALIAVLWVLSGSWESVPDKADEQVQSEAQDTLFKVKVERSVAVPLKDRIDLQGEIIANRVVDIKAETDASAEKLLVSKGDQVRQGQLLVTLSLNDRLARLERAKADLKVSQLDLESGLALKEKRLLSENQHQKNLAAVTAAKAQVKEIETEIAYTNIKAPFAGVVDAVHIELGDFVSQGMPVAKLVDQSQLKIRVQVPQQHISKLKLGQAVEAELLDGTRISGRTSFIASAADPQTRSFTVEALADNAEAIRHFGQSARVSLIVGEQAAHKLSSSLLSLDKSGALQVMSVDDDNRVQAFKVNLIRSENDGIWLSGLPESFDLITVGQGFVSQGQQVEAVR